MGHLTPMAVSSSTSSTSPTPSSTRGRLAPLFWVSSCALVFAILLVLVRLSWAPLESVDRGVADGFNHLVADDSPLVTVLKRITWFGSNGVLWTVVIAAAVILAIRRLPRLALYVVVAGAGALVLDPVLKSLVGRLRPVVPHPIAHGTGNSFPSGHSLGSIVCYGAVLLAFLPGVSPRFRWLARALAAALVFLIGLSRLMLGVHYLSDVVGAWALGIAWLGITAFAFELSRAGQGQRVTAPATEGLEPEAAADLEAAEPEPPATHGHPLASAAGVVVAWVLIVGIITGLGELIVRYGDGNVLGDRTIPKWFAAHRTPDLNRWSAVTSWIGATEAVLILSIATCVVAIAALRRWRPIIFVAVLMVGELGAFLVSSTVVHRPRPEAPTMDKHLPTFAYPSGHIAATLCIYFAMALLVIGHTRTPWRWLMIVPVVAVPVIVTVSRFYRGEHHPTDALGSLIFAALWTAAAYRLIRPNADHDEPRTARAGVESRREQAVAQ
jgi:undecaprenyl-diphosphatase